MALASEAVLTALNHFINQGGGSRGARAICDSSGDSVPEIRDGKLEEFRFRRERPEHKAEQLLVRYEHGTFTVSTCANRPFDEAAKSFFERDWPDWLTGRIFDLQA